MSHTYDAAVSGHYASYRPPLHAMILEKLLSGQHFETGLDIGCGTGQSSLPLADYCDQVVAVDPSQEMLDEATAHPRIIYKHGQADQLPVADSSTHLMSFAGALFYTNNQATFDELQRVGRPDCLTLVYDFELLIYEILSQIGFDLPEDGATYDHSVGLTGVAGFEEVVRKSEREWLVMTADELAHVVLSTHDRYVAISEQLKTEAPYDEVSQRLAAMGDELRLGADLYYASYRFTGG